ncbi:hypothetical protein D9758_016426 [Tetrapyrgos nigripes]|uniref:KOW domain-containing protein n=1 Tax=Tetrapyrgos nigripes TaxID=182062 RepID=A0A8H5CMU3_9AGAR|nr:hypothetical protein D9758_016426 [Tetrapyrgos nigripes]
MRFLDIEASDDEDDTEFGDEDPVGSGDELGVGSDQDEEDGGMERPNTNGNCYDEDDDEPLPEDNMTAEEYLEHLATKYTQGIPESNKTGANILQSLPGPIRTSLLTIENQQQFWKVKCKSGQETQLVLDLMHFALGRGPVSAPSQDLDSEPSSSGALQPPTTAPHTLYPYLNTHYLHRQPYRRGAPGHKWETTMAIPLMPNRTPEDSEDPDGWQDQAVHGWELQALRCVEKIGKFALDPEGNIANLTEEIIRDLSVSKLPVIWRQAIDATSIDPFEASEDPHAGKRRFEEKHVRGLEKWIDTVKSTALSSSSSTSPPQRLPRLRNVLSLSTSPDSHPPPSRLIQAQFRSAFTVAGISGSVYLEADLGSYPQETDIVAFLRGHPAVPIGSVIKQRNDAGLTRAWVSLQPLTANQVGELLNWRPADIKPSQWIKVTKGPYKGDTALVVRRVFDTGQRRLLITVIPRIPEEKVDDDDDKEQPILPPALELQAKRKAENDRPTQHLFCAKDHPGAKELYFQGHGRGKIFEYKGEEYHYGLLVTTIPYSSASLVDVDMDNHSRRLFKASNSPYIVSSLPTPRDWHFFVDDRVEGVQSEVLAGIDRDVAKESRLRKGTIKSIDGDACWVQFDDLADFAEEGTVVKIPKLNLLKRFYVGDWVIVEGGPSAGRTGWVLTHFDESLVLYYDKPGTQEGEEFSAHPNECRLTTPRTEGVAPWINAHVHIVAGKVYKGYTGVVLDVSKSRDGFVMLQVDLSSVGISVWVRHDDVKETCTNKSLRRAIPLKPHQMGLWQITWPEPSAKEQEQDELPRAPNIPQHYRDSLNISRSSQMVPMLDPHNQQLLTPENSLLLREPSNPWIGKECVVIRGPHKMQGWVRRVRRDHRKVSGLAVLVELQLITTERGGDPRHEVDYTWIRDQTTGLPLHARYPLTNVQRYWEPLIHVKAIPVKNPCSYPSLEPLPRRGPSSDGRPMTPEPEMSVDRWDWRVDRRLDRKEFWASYQPSDGGKRVDKVTARVDYNTKKIQLRMGGAWISVDPVEVDSVTRWSNPKTARFPMLVKQGHHTGQIFRPIFHDYQGEQLVLIGAVYDNWGQASEVFLEEIRVKYEDCLHAATDPNKKHFADEVAAKRSSYSHPEETGGKRRRPKPKVSRLSNRE